MVVSQKLAQQKRVCLCICTGGAFDVSPAALKGLREFMSRECNLEALQVPLARLVALLPLHCHADDGAQSQW